MILDRILEQKRTEIEAAWRREAPEVLAQRAEACASAPRDIATAHSGGEAPRVIAEVKRRPPRMGLFRADFDP
jgi:indole-3-glycerol phosphate synthase